MVSSTPRPYFTPGKDPVPIVQGAGWAPGPVRTGGKSRPTGIRSPDGPARSQSPSRLSYPAHNIVRGTILKWRCTMFPSVFLRLTCVACICMRSCFLNDCVRCLVKISNRGRCILRNCRNTARHIKACFVPFYLPTGVWGWRDAFMM